MTIGFDAALSVHGMLGMSGCVYFDSLVLARILKLSI